MKQRCSIYIVGCILLLAFPSIVAAIVYQTLPANIPLGLPDQINGKYRIIEHDRLGKMWCVYDVQRWKKHIDKEFSEKGIKMYPPIHMYLYFGNSWQYMKVNKPMETTYMNELVTIIEKGQPLKQPSSVGKQLSGSEAQDIVMKAFYPANKHLWSFTNTGHKGGVLVCAFARDLPSSIGIWWAKGNKVYNVNGIARSKTKKFELTFDPAISVPEAFDKCKSLR